MKLYFLIFGLAMGSQVWAQQTVKSAIEDFQKVSHCTERIWPGFNWKDLQVLFVDDSKDLQAVFDGRSGQVTQVSLKSIQHRAELNSSFSFFTEDGKEWMSLNSKYAEEVKGPHQFSGLGMHESFHQIGQKHWVNHSQARGTLLPVHWEPRYIRAMIEKNLMEALKDGSLQSLQKAAYWYQKWVSEYPDEVRSTTDGYEGTARYAEFLGMALANYGCDISEEKLKNWVLQKIQNWPSLLSLKGTRPLDTEGYSIGSLAAFILREQRSVPQWEEKVAQGDTPLQILLDSVSPLSEEMDAGVVKGFKETAQKQQTEIQSLLGPTYKNLESSSLVMLSVPRSWKPGSTSYKGFYMDVEKSYWFGVIYEDLDFISGTSHLHTQGGLPDLITNHMDPCSHMMNWNFAVTKAEISRVEKDHFQVRSPKIEGRLKGMFKRGSDGTVWFCGQD